MLSSAYTPTLNKGWLTPDAGITHVKVSLPPRKYKKHFCFSIVVQLAKITTRCSGEAIGIILLPSA